MSIEIYYFSGTGNSLAVARDIARKTKGTLISISSVIDRKSIKTGADTIGIVFPSYLAQGFGVPLIVEKFIGELEDIGSKYLFAVCTCGGWELVNALPTLKRLAKMMKQRGGDRVAEFSIKLPMNNLTYPSGLVNQNREIMFEKSAHKIDEICMRVSDRRQNAFKTVKSLFNTIMVPTYSLLKYFYATHLKKMSKEPKDTKLTNAEMIHLSDKSIHVDNKCNGCATCVKVCPARNIEMIEMKPVWRHHCEMCLACDEWCPQRAVRHWCKTEGKNYRHPSVKISDMLKQSGN